MKIKNTRMVAIICALIAVAMLALVFSLTLFMRLQATLRNSEKERENYSRVLAEVAGLTDEISNQDFLPIGEVMKAAGYVQAGAPNILAYTLIAPPISIELNMQTGQCRKNEYTFDVKDRVIMINGEPYMHRNMLSAILSLQIQRQGESYSFSLPSQDPDDWLKRPLLVAHAGGGTDDGETKRTYTNSLEALVQNYDLGHRIFEFDLILTKDGYLVGAHDWPYLEFEEQPTLSQFMNHKLFGVYTSMDIDAILDQMIVNKDLYIVTDTKILTQGDPMTVRPFEIIRDKAMERDPELLLRIIPQLYQQHMYESIGQVYTFPNYIYTLYGSPDNDDQVLEFVADKDDLKAVTMYMDRPTAPFIQRLTDSGKVIFVHTLNEPSAMKPFVDMGITGFYTDFVTPDQYMRCFG